ncbi:PREDICTED: uncharacterized protein LOC100635280 isoform X2 [Amphimedon queenslandica]|uniref:Myb-like domain-containing protein n=1 Tax=Amphimedon queenslandica TaxID=400682 RepID=A0A1X7UBR8_AMPQE|nr:PREDICTED: uncharacterized protein LOC100635280 isoform X2 [Amphimedon queenslandica]|eukprot:XP_019855098.1 PREDICTED: uncharacterized protein LOC100635280 isoform X2 [Amphimedon queenslandica]
MWYIPGIDEALQLINQYNPHNNNDIELISAFGNPPRVPDVVQDVIMTHGIFWQYPYHLPEHGLSPVESSGTQGSKYFTTTEDYLLVLGMDHYGSSSWKLIQEKLLPTKTTKQLHLRVKNLTSKRTKQDNVIKYYKRTGEIKIPFDKDAIDPYLFTRLPQWIIKYHLKREQVEYEEREKKEKRKEELKKIATTYNLLSSSSSSSSCPPSSSSSSSSPGGSKRNLKDDLESVAPSKTLKKGKKRMRLSLGPIETQSETKTGCKGDYRQLLYMAGLEGSDPAARYAFNYLTEVKAMTMSSPENYNTFLKLLITARKREWSPGKLYMAVKPVLQQWPYLLKLFMAFLDPKDAVQAKIADKIDFEQVKTFSRNLQDQYGDSPLQLSDILSKLRSLEAADDTRKNQIVLELNEMMLSHDELLSDLRHFVSGVLPAKRITEKSQNDFEEVNISSSDQKQAGDDFEEVSVPHDWEGSSSQRITSSP